MCDEVDTLCGRTKKSTAGISGELAAKNKHFVQIDHTQLKRQEGHTFDYEFKC